MNFEQIVSSVLLVISSEKLASSLSELLPTAYFFPVHKVKTISAAKRMLADRAYDYVIISSPLPDETGIEFAMDISAKEQSIIMLMTAAEIYEEVYDQVVDYGVFSIAKPVTRSSFETAMRWLTVAKMRSRQSEEKTLTLEDKMKEIRVINRAKWFLISEEHMEEEQAHRFIEKQAMDRCRPKRQIAQEIIDRYQKKE